MVDGWSIGILIREAQQALAARIAGDAPRWSTPASSAAVVQTATNELLGTDDTPTPTRERMRTHWRTALDGAPTHLPLPGPAMPSDSDPFAATFVDAVIPADVRDRVQDLVARNDTTFFHIAHVALAGVLSTFTGLDDVVISIPSAGRDSASALGAVGMFVQTLPLRTAGVLRAPLADAIRASESTLADAEANSALGYRGIVDAANAGSSGSTPAYLDVMLTVDGGFGLDDDAQRQFGIRRVRVAQSRVPLEFSIRDHGPGRDVEVVVIVAPGRVDVAIAERMVEAFVRMLGALAQARERPQ